jgi:hypothetical protein
LTDTTTVNAAVVRDGKILATASGLFTKGAKPVKSQVSRQRGDMGAAEDPINTKPPRPKKKK